MQHHRAIAENGMVDEMLSDGDGVITRFTVRGTHRGPFRGIPGTGRMVSVMGIAIDRVVAAKRVEGWAVLDLFSVMQQIGAVPQPRERSGRSDGATG